jgi:hypothetical protein
VLREAGYDLDKAMVVREEKREDRRGLLAGHRSRVAEREGEALSELVAVFARAAVVFTLSALASGVVKCVPLSFPIIFLGLGFLIGVRRSLAYLFCTVYYSPCCLSMDASRGTTAPQSHRPPGLRHLR